MAVFAAVVFDPAIFDAGALFGAVPPQTTIGKTGTARTLGSGQIRRTIGPTMTIAERIEGQTDRLLLPLLDDGAAFDATGFTVSGVTITARDGTVVNVSGDFDWLSGSTSTVYYDPDAGDFVAAKSPYNVRVKVTDADGKVRFYPNTERARIRVRRP